MRESFVFYRSFYDAIKELPKENRLEVYEAIFELALNDIDVTEKLSPVSRAIFMMAKPPLEANIKRYENGKKGGRKPKDKGDTENQTESKAEPKENQNQTKQKPKQNQTESKAEPYKDKDVDKDKESKAYALQEPPSIVSPLKSGETHLSKSGEKLLAQALKDSQMAVAGAGESFLRRLIAYRAQIKHPLKTLKGLKGMVRDFAQTHHATGMSFDELFELMSEREWRTIKPEYVQNSRASPPKSTDTFREKAMSAINEFASQAKERV